MKLSHLALTVIEDPDNDGRYHWLLLLASGDADRVQEFEASEGSFESADAAFEAGAARWRETLNREDDDPVGDGSGS